MPVCFCTLLKMWTFVWESSAFEVLYNISSWHPSWVSCCHTSVCTTSFVRSHRLSVSTCSCLKQLFLRKHIIVLQCLESSKHQLDVWLLFLIDKQLHQVMAQRSQSTALHEILHWYVSSSCVRATTYDGATISQEFFAIVFSQPKQFQVSFFMDFSFGLSASGWCLRERSSAELITK